MMFDIFVDQAKIEDALFIKEGITNEELEEAIIYYIGSNDPEVNKAMDNYKKAVQEESQRLGPVAGMVRVWDVIKMIQ